MTVYQGTAYQTATIILEVETDPATGKEVRPERYLDFDRREYRADDYDDNIVVTCYQGETPDQISNRVYGNSTHGWVIADFNDWVAEDMFVTFEGGETLILPSPNTLHALILNDDGSTP